MATADEIKAMVRAHVDGDYVRFKSVVQAIAANAELKSPAFARTLRSLADRSQRQPMLVALPVQSQQVLDSSTPTTRIEDVILEDATRARIDRIIAEQAAREKLFVHGLMPMRKFLFVGSPGTGKTMMASALACNLRIPLLRVQLHGTIASHLGETTANLAKIFENIRRMRGVYLFDEFDALAVARGTKDEVGEMRRVVNSLLQFIELDDSDSLIVAATNDRQAIDRAMFRRFDDVIDFPMPTADVAERLIRSRIIAQDGIDWHEVRLASAGVGHADLVSACDAVSKSMILADRTTISTDDLVAALRGRHREA